MWAKADQYGTKAGLAMDVKAYSDKYVDLFSERDKTPKDEGKRKLFSNRISRMYESKATDEVRVMTPWETGPDPTRFFHQDEWPILEQRIDSGEITKIIEVNPENFKKAREYDPKRFGLPRGSVMKGGWARSLECESCINEGIRELEAGNIRGLSELKRRYGV